MKYTLIDVLVLRQVNQYPGHRDFKAIGSGGDDFKQTIVRAVEDIVGPVNQDRVMQRPSSQGKFISVTLRDVKVQNPDQVRRARHFYVYILSLMAHHYALLNISFTMALLHSGACCICSNEKGQKVTVLPLKQLLAAHQLSRA